MFYPHRLLRFVTLVHAVHLHTRRGWQCADEQGAIDQLTATYLIRYNPPPLPSATSCQCYISAHHRWIIRTELQGLHTQLRESRSLGVIGRASHGKELDGETAKPIVSVSLGPIIYTTFNKHQDYKINLSKVLPQNVQKYARVSHLLLQPPSIFLVQTQRSYVVVAGCQLQCNDTVRSRMFHDGVHQPLTHTSAAVRG